LINNSHSSSRKGDLAEYYAVTWLWDHGYEVFPNAGSQGMADMIAWHPKTEEVILIDVKMVRNKRESDNRSIRTQAQIEKNVCLLLYNADTRQLRFVEHDKDGKSD
jgi:Holliday junction resolvase